MEIYLKQIEPLERIPCLLGYDSVNEFETFNQGFLVFKNTGSPPYAKTIWSSF